MLTFFHHGASIPTPMTPSRCYSGSWAAAVTVVVVTHRLPDDLRCSAFVPNMALTSWSTTVRHHPDPEADDLRAILDRYLNDADRDDAEILVCAIPMPEHILNVLGQSASINQLVVIGTSKPDLTSELLSRRAAKILRKSNCSVMIARGRRGRLTTDSLSG